MQSNPERVNFDPFNSICMVICEVRRGTITTSCILSCNQITREPAQDRQETGGHAGTHVVYCYVDACRVQLIKHSG